MAENKKLQCIYSTQLVFLFLGVLAALITLYTSVNKKCD